MLNVKFDYKDLERTLNNSVDYSQGFLNGVQLQRVPFTKFLGGFILEAMYKYIDSRARMNPNKLHHVYEPGEVGTERGRLFTLSVMPTRRGLTFTGNFKQSVKPSENSNVPFADKASIMENGISITIEPKNSDVLAFEDDGETVFTTEAIYVAHPGGDEVAGSFGKTVEEFFSVYLNSALLAPIYKDLATAEEFAQNFAAGSRGGRSVGVRAGRKYLTVSGVEIL